MSHHNEALTRTSATPENTPSADDDPTADRDARTMNYARSKGAGRAYLEPFTPGGRRDTWGGAALRNTDANFVGVVPSPEYEMRPCLRVGRDVPIGYARYAPPGVNLHDYKYHRVAGWQVAVPRGAGGARVEEILYRIFHYGPQSAGYVRLGDTLVPASLDPGDRATLAGTAVWEDKYPLGP